MSQILDPRTALRNANALPKLFNDHFQNFKKYNIPKAQLIIADIPYNVGKDFGNGASADRRDDYHAWLSQVWTEC